MSVLNRLRYVDIQDLVCVVVTHQAVIRQLDCCLLVVDL